MAFKKVLSMVPADEYEAANAFLVGVYGDPPDAVEFDMNAYLDGEDSAVATHSLGDSVMSAADAITFANSLAVRDGCASMTFPSAQSIDPWALALSAWNLRQVEG